MADRAGYEQGGFDQRPVRLLRHDHDGPVDTSRWPATVPAVAQMLRDGLELPAGLTVLVGENGSGKSTVIEILAEACGLNPQGGSAGARFRTRDSEPGIGSQFTVGVAAPVVLLPARRHHARAVHLPGGTPGPAA